MDAAAVRARDHDRADGWSIGLDDVRYWLITPEPEPLATFGPVASRAVHELLEPEGITFVGSACPVVERGVVLLDARAERIEADRIVSLPLLDGPRTPGLPFNAHGFIPVDDCGRVPNTPDVYAAGDATAFSIKQGGLACQQADVIAEQPRRPERPSNRAGTARCCVAS